MNDELKEKIREAKEIIGDKAALIIAQDMKLEGWDEKNLKSCCPKHHEKTPSFIWDNKNQEGHERYYFHCFSCGANIGLLDHYMSFYNLSYLEAVAKLFDEANIKHDFTFKGLRTKRDYKYPPRIQSKSRAKVEEYCHKRMISNKTLDYCDVQQDDKGNIIWHLYDENDVLWTSKVRPSKRIEKGEMKEWYLPGFDNEPVLFNMNRIDPEQTLVITEGQFDTLSVIESGYNNCVSVPGGAENLKWIERCFDWLEQFHKIVIFGDADEPGRKMQREVCNRLGSWRTFIVEIPEKLKGIDGKEYFNIKDANEVLVRCGPETVIDLINSAKQSPIQDVIDIDDVRDFNIEEAPGLYTGIPGFDKALYKFVMPSVCLVTGRPGSGKTSIVNQLFILEPLHQGYDVFLYSGEMPKDVLKSWILTQAAGRENVTVKNEHVRIIKPEVKKAIGEWVGGRVILYDNEDDNSLDNILNRAESVVRRFGAKVVVLDNLTAIGLGSDVNQNNILQKQKELILRLKGFAYKFGVLVVLIAHPNKRAMNYNDRLTGMDIAGSSDLYNFCQYCFSVRRIFEDEKKGEKDSKTGKYKKGKEPVEFDLELELLKNRFTGRLTRLGMYFDPPSYRFYTTPASLFKKYKWDKSTTPIPTKDPNPHKEEPDWAKD